MSYSKLALFCKTYIRDYGRVEKLFETIKKHNKDNIPFYVTAPASDKGLLQEVLGKEGWTFIPDEEIFTSDRFRDGWETQMLVKLHAYKKIPADNILILDSDTFFIRDFYEKDFIAYDNIPYTIIHENVQVAEYEAFLKNKQYSKNKYSKAVAAYRDVFGGKSNRVYDYGPNPHLWNRKVLEHLNSNYLDYHGISMEDFCDSMKAQYGIHFRETLTYGEYLLATKVIDIVPSGPLFKCYHWKEMYDFELMTGQVDEEKHQWNYLGVVIQSNWL
jgi:hypothetical protein